MRTVIIDVRTRKEFSENSLSGAINIPSNSFGIKDFDPYKDKQICLVCESGARAANVMTELKWAGFKNVSILDKHMNELSEIKIKSREEGWTIDRQFRLALAFLLGISLLGIYLHIAYALVIPLILFSGLLYSSISDNCYLKLLIATFPWNKK